MEYPVVDDAPVHPALAAFDGFKENGLQVAWYIANAA